MPLEAKIFDDNNNEAPRNTEGELVVRLAGEDPRRGFFAGYLNGDAATETGWRGGWWHSGDIVRQDESGMLYFVDRQKNMIRRSGENIAATEVETVLCAHPAVGQIAILPVPDEKNGEEILACIVPSADYPADANSAKSIFDYCNEKLAYYKAPGWVLYLDRMPLTATQKVSKSEIFAPGEDPRGLPGAIDLRPMKRRR
jgi:crotonobetaine/carnitine-CoA ligase